MSLQNLQTQIKNLKNARYELNLGILEVEENTRLWDILQKTLIDINKTIETLEEEETLIIEEYNQFYPL